MTDTMKKLYQASSLDKGKKQLDIVNIAKQAPFFGLSPALHLSSAAGHDNCVHILLRLHNADGSLTDCSGQTAQDLALKPAVQRIFEPVAP